MASEKEKIIMEKKKYNGIYVEIVRLAAADAIAMSAPGDIGSDSQDDFIFDW